MTTYLNNEPLEQTMPVIVRGRSFNIRITPGETGWFVVECIDMPGCISQGRTKESAKKNIQDAIRGFLDCDKSSLKLVTIPA